MTREVFDVEMGRLIVLRGWPDSVEEYFPLVSDIPEDVFPDAITHALKTRTWFPTPAEVRADCDYVNRQQRTVTTPVGHQLVELPEGGRVVEFTLPWSDQPLRLKVQREWNHYCEDCSDTGWASRWCGTEGKPLAHQKRVPCQRRNPHLSHEWVEPCACLDWNPTIKRKREAQAKYSQAPEKVDAA